jgi:hypothetical protein
MFHLYPAIERTSDGTLILMTQASSRDGGNGVKAGFSHLLLMVCCLGHAMKFASCFGREVHPRTKATKFSGQATSGPGPILSSTAARLAAPLSTHQHPCLAFHSRLGACAWIFQDPQLLSITRPPGLGTL